MSDAEQEILREGGCLCGRTRYQALGEPLWVSYCHCQSCRRATGAPVTAYAGYPEGAVRFTDDEPSFYASSAGAKRGFCPACGSPISYQGESWPGEFHIHLGTLDDPESLRPDGQGAFVGERLSWVNLLDPDENGGEPGLSG